MNICVAGKNNIAVDVCNFIVEHFNNANIFALVNKTDDGIDGWQKSFLKYVKNTPKVNLVTLELLYGISDLVFISTEFDKIIKPDRFRSKNLYNIHFSLLPKYKGVFTSVWPILNNDKFSGVTLHKIDNGIDTGEIIAQKKFLIKNDETAYSLYHKLIKNGTNLVIKHLEKLFAGNVCSTPQGIRGSTYYSRQSLNFANLRVDLNCTASQIDAQIRAFYFPAFQLPQVYDVCVVGTRITTQRSIERPGTILSETENFIKISTIDYDIILYKLL